MKLGTKSVLFGAHQFLIHPWFVAAAWWQLYGFPFDPRLWVAFFVHDLGYVGCDQMDNEEGERHVEFGAWVMTKLFDWRWRRKNIGIWIRDDSQSWMCGPWGQFCLLHSRFYAKKHHRPFSRLCVADKLAFCLTPKCLYLALVRVTGEIHEYMALAKARTEIGEPKYASMNIASDDVERWYYDVEEYLRRWVDTHKDGREDTWTPAQST